MLGGLRASPAALPGTPAPTSDPCRTPACTARPIHPPVCHVFVRGGVWAASGGGEVVAVPEGLTSRLSASGASFNGIFPAAACSLSSASCGAAERSVLHVVHPWSKPCPWEKGGGRWGHRCRMALQEAADDREWAGLAMRRAPRHLTFLLRCAHCHPMRADEDTVAPAVVRLRTAIAPSLDFVLSEGWPWLPCASSREWWCPQGALRDSRSQGGCTGSERCAELQELCAGGHPSAPSPPCTCQARGGEGLRHPACKTTRQGRAS